MIIFPFFITVFASVLLTLSSKGLGGNGKFRPIVNYIFYTSSFQLIIPFFDLLFNKLLKFPYVFNLGISNEWFPQDPWHALFYDKICGLSAGIIFMYLLIIIRTPSIIRWNFKINLKRSILATSSLLLMFWIIFIAWPFWFYYLPLFLPFPTGADAYSFVFLICIGIAFPYFWKYFKKERELT